jgi:hypothetical protein
MQQLRPVAGQVSKTTRGIPDEKQGLLLIDLNDRPGVAVGVL